MAHPSPGPAQIIGLDHVVIRVADLDAAQTLYQRLGFSLTPRGFHTGRGSANHTTPFSGGTYIELIQTPDGGPHTTFGGKSQGPVAIALKPASSERLYSDLTAAGFALSPPRDLTRPVALTNETRDARFLNLDLPQGGVGELRLFACQHLTPELVWRPDWLTHANGVTCVTGLIAVHDAPATLAGFYASLFGNVAAQKAGNSLTVLIGRQTVTVLTPADFLARFPDVDLPANAATGWFAGVTLCVETISTTARILSQSGIATRWSDRASLVVSPEVTGGTVIEFVSN